MRFFFESVFNIIAFFAPILALPRLSSYLPAIPTTVVDLVQRKTAPLAPS